MRARFDCAESMKQADEMSQRMEVELQQSKQEAAGLRDSCHRLAKEIKSLQDEVQRTEQQRRNIEVRYG